MVFECPYILFGCIAEMDMGRDKLVPCLPGFSYGLLLVCTDFIVQHLEIRLMAETSEYFHDGIVHFDVVSVASRLEGGILNGVSIEMKCDHDVLIATPCSDWEATAVIGVHLAGEILIDVDLSGRYLGKKGYKVSGSATLAGVELVGLGLVERTPW